MAELRRVAHGASELLRSAQEHEVAIGATGHARRVAAELAASENLSGWERGL